MICLGCYKDFKLTKEQEKRAELVNFGGRGNGKTIFNFYGFVVTHCCSVECAVAAVKRAWELLYNEDEN